MLYGSSIAQLREAEAFQAAQRERLHRTNFAHASRVSALPTGALYHNSPPPPMSRTASELLNGSAARPLPTFNDTANSVHLKQLMSKPRARDVPIVAPRRGLAPIADRAHSSMSMLWPPNVHHVRAHEATAERGTPPPAAATPEPSGWLQRSTAAARDAAEERKRREALEDARIQLQTRDVPRHFYRGPLPNGTARPPSVAATKRAKKAQRRRATMLDGGTDDASFSQPTSPAAPATGTPPVSGAAATPGGGGTTFVDRSRSPTPLMTSPVMASRSPAAVGTPASTTINNNNTNAPRGGRRGHNAIAVRTLPPVRDIVFVECRCRRPVGSVPLCMHSELYLRTRLITQALQRDVVDAEAKAWNALTTAEGAGRGAIAAAERNRAAAEKAAKPPTPITLPNYAGGSMRRRSSVAHVKPLSPSESMHHSHIVGSQQSSRATPMSGAHSRVASPPGA